MDSMAGQVCVVSHNYGHHNYISVRPLDARCSWAFSPDWLLPADGGDICLCELCCIRRGPNA